MKAKNDRYRRTIGYVSYDQSKDLGEEFLKVGLVWVWRFSNNEIYKRLQAQAKEKGKGLWSDEKAIDPHQWRKGRKEKKK